MKLGARLAAIAAYVLPGSRVADIGTDHGYLAAHLVARGDVGFVIAGDVNEGPLATARELINNLGLTDKIAVRLGDGLAVVRPEEVDTVVIAGMGGTTMIHILTPQTGLAHKLKRLILQPMVGAGTLRLWLVKNGFCLVDERLVREEGRIYEIIVAEPALVRRIICCPWNLGLCYGKNGIRCLRNIGSKCWLISRRCRKACGKVHREANTPNTGRIWRRCCF